MFRYGSFRSILSTASLLIALAAPSLAWEGAGHKFVTHLAVSSLPSSPLRDLLEKNRAWLADASSHPDRWRNRVDHAEAPRHFLDSERFTPTSERIPARYSELLGRRTYDQLRTDGVAPWAAERVWKLLVLALRQRRWEDALVQAAYLSHYVGDSHVPFHATENYDGQLSTPVRRGIHRRFEGTAVERSIRLEQLRPGPPEGQGPVSERVLGAIRESLSDVPRLIEADQSAAAAAGGTEGDAYWTEFLAVARPIAVRRLETAGRRLAGLYEAAWREAGRPNPGTLPEMTDDWLPAAPPFVGRGQTAPPAWPIVPEDEKGSARNRSTVVPVWSPRLHRSVPITVLLPSSYDKDRRRYPVLYLLHGASGNHADWNSKSGIAAYSRDLPLIIVMTDAQGDSFYTDSPGFGAIESMIVHDVVKTVDERYRTIARREGRSIAGLSMGGYGAWRIALDYPRTFASAASMSGALGWGEGSPVPGLSERIWPANTPEEWKRSRLHPRLNKLLRRAQWSGPILWFDCGKDDFLIESNRQMEASLASSGIPYEFSEFDGAHDWIYWDSHIRDVLNFVRRTTAQPGP